MAFIDTITKVASFKKRLCPGLHFPRKVYDLWFLTVCQTGIEHHDGLLEPLIVAIIKQKDAQLLQRIILGCRRCNSIHNYINRFPTARDQNIYRGALDPSQAI